MRVEVTILARTMGRVWHSRRFAADVSVLQASVALTVKQTLVKNPRSSLSPSQCSLVTNTDCIMLSLFSTIIRMQEHPVQWPLHCTGGARDFQLKLAIPEVKMGFDNLLVTSKSVADDCEAKPCLNCGSCVDKVSGFVCNCPDGFTGETCERGPESLCETNSCGADTGAGICFDLLASRRKVCVCNRPGYTTSKKAFKN